MRLLKRVCLDSRRYNIVWNVYDLYYIYACSGCVIKYLKQIGIHSIREVKFEHTRMWLMVYTIYTRSSTNI